VVKNQIEVFWIATPRTIVGYQCFGGLCCLHLQCKVTSPWRWRCHNPEDLNLENCSSPNRAKSHSKFLCWTWHIKGQYITYLQFSRRTMKQERSTN